FGGKQGGANMDAEFDYICTASADGHQVKVVGEVDIATAPQLAEALAQFATSTVRVDITGVTFLDSSGLHALYAAHRYISRNGGRMNICGELDPRIKRVIDMTELTEVFEFDPQHVDPRPFA